MSEIITKLEELVEKTVKKSTSNTQAREGAALLLDLYKESSDKAKIAEYLCTLHFSVCQLFFEQATSDLQPSEIESICAVIRRNERYLKNNSYLGTVRGFIVAAVLIKANVAFARAFLLDTIIDAEKDGEFPRKVIDHFKKYVFEPCTLLALQALEERSWSSEDKHEKFRKIVQMSLERETTQTDNQSVKDGEASASVAADDSNGIDNPTAQSVIAEDVLDNNQRKQSIEETPPTKVKPKRESASKLLQMLSKAQREANTLLHDLRNSSETAKETQREANTLLSIVRYGNETMQTLRQKVSEREERIAALQGDIDERESQIDELQAKIGNLEAHVAELKSEVDDLNNRLAKTLAMDASANNQDMITLKTDISNALKLEYQDYVDNKTAECSQDQFEAYRASLTRIFKTLRRFDIALD
ncbi:hypothetical protein FACS1894216_15380 [Synergistales bacterium]|nr:hypothetical protein FACS1894216_15380 [Synergistales bacterium]